MNQNHIPLVPSQGEEQAEICFEGEALASFLNSIERNIQSSRNSDTTLPEKIWFKKQFAIGVNEVTRVLERMSLSASTEISSETRQTKHKASPPVRLQVILVASDCNPRWLTRHLPDLASSRKVPVIYVKDKKAGSLRLGTLFKLKTAIAIGIKVKGNDINQFIKEVLHDQARETSHL
ncbi:ribonuclease P protein subunit p38 [Impatiens glandulifera]|uniref:ribonuclease P protein subunit p38 n=1 Tax=Impatiens glandulifera TaxID=253017 RepID=UPI001FB0FE4E|nr:ribonuclease P protein subunit p38 [Impatiens glandulifera]